MYTVEYAKTGRAGCKFCSEKISKGELRVGKQVPANDSTSSRFKSLLSDSGGEGRLLRHRDWLVSLPLLLEPGASV